MRRLVLCTHAADAMGAFAAKLCDAMNPTFPDPLDDEALAATWDTAWSSALGRPAPAGLRLEVLKAWSEPQRAYHDPRHLRECLALWTLWREHAENPGELALALWFHDAVYVPGAADNELKSAAWAARAMTRAGGGSEPAQRVHDLVMATRHDAPVPPTTPGGTAQGQGGQGSPGGHGRNDGQATDPDTQLLLDIDLAILGSPPERFERYDQDVRQEYAAVPGHLYRARRAAVLQGFLDRPRIYGHPPAFELLESQARINLTGALSRLAQ